jgi:hypothetical protein
VLTGCLGALDGLLIPIECPRQRRDFGREPLSYNPLSYFCREGFYALVVSRYAHCMAGTTLRGSPQRRVAPQGNDTATTQQGAPQEHEAEEEGEEAEDGSLRRQVCT